MYDFTTSTLSVKTHKFPSGPSPVNGQRDLSPFNDRSLTIR